MRDAEEVTGAGHEDEVVAEDDKPGREVARQSDPAGALHDVEGRREQHVAAEREDHRGGVQRAEPSEARILDPEIEFGSP